MIVGVEQFAADSQILVSGYAPSFNSSPELAEHSLCNDMGIELPKYSPTYVADHYTIRFLQGNLCVIHTPGHTPDELALWDEGEQMLYVGDTLYEWVPIIFPREGSIVDWFKSIDALSALIQPFNDAKISAGHVTAAQPAKAVLLGAKRFIEDVLAERLEPVEKLERRGEENVHYVQDGQRYSLVCPTRLISDARREVQFT